MHTEAIFNIPHVLAGGQGFLVKKKEKKKRIGSTRSVKARYHDSYGGVKKMLNVNSRFLIFLS